MLCLPRRLFFLLLLLVLFPCLQLALCNLATKSTVTQDKAPGTEPCLGSRGKARGSMPAGESQLENSDGMCQRRKGIYEIGKGFRVCLHAWKIILRALSGPELNKLCPSEPKACGRRQERERPGMTALLSHR